MVFIRKPNLCPLMLLIQCLAIDHRKRKKAWRQHLLDLLLDAQIKYTCKLTRERAAPKDCINDLHL